jgi:hypothetical protein
MKSDEATFLKGIGKWSMAVIGAVLLGTAPVGIEQSAQAAEATSRDKAQADVVTTPYVPTPADAGLVTPAWTNWTNWVNRHR